MAENIRVVVRCRPAHDNERNYQQAVKFHDDCQIEVLDHVYRFDRAYDLQAKQRSIYDDNLTDIIEGTLSGYNGTVFAYGQTGSGKTHTMSGSAESPGVIPRAFGQIFARIQADEERSFAVRVTFVEIYMENIRDLLVSVHQKSGEVGPGGFSSNQGSNYLQAAAGDRDGGWMGAPQRPSAPPGNPVNLELKEHAETGVYVKGLTSYVCRTEDEMKARLNQGNARRTTGVTAMNAQSSRSHAIFSVMIETTQQFLFGGGREGGEGNLSRMLRGKLHLVDLAGSERQSKSEAQGVTLKEAAKINLSLLTLGSVISALASNPRPSHIPYRDSKLTRLLEGSLGGNAKTVMIATVGPSAYNAEETLQTLRYANRVKAIVNKPTVNSDLKDRLIEDLTRELELARAQNTLPPDLEEVPLVKMLRSEVTKLKALLRSAERATADAESRAEEAQNSAAILQSHFDRMEEENREWEAQAVAALTRLRDLDEQGRALSSSEAKNSHVDRHSVLGGGTTADAATAALVAAATTQGMPPLRDLLVPLAARGSDTSEGHQRPTSKMAADTTALPNPVDDRNPTARPRVVSATTGTEIVVAGSPEQQQAMERLRQDAHTLRAENEELLKALGTAVNDEEELLELREKAADLLRQEAELIVDKDELLRNKEDLLQQQETNAELLVRHEELLETVERMARDGHASEETWRLIEQERATEQQRARTQAVEILKQQNHRPQKRGRGAGGYQGYAGNGSMSDYYNKNMTGGYGDVGQNGNMQDGYSSWEPSNIHVGVDGIQGPFRSAAYVVPPPDHYVAEGIPSSTVYGNAAAPGGRDALQQVPGGVFSTGSPMRSFVVAGVDLKGAPVGGFSLTPNAQETSTFRHQDPDITRQNEKAAKQRGSSSTVPAISSTATSSNNCNVGEQAGFSTGGGGRPFIEVETFSPDVDVKNYSPPFVEMLPATSVFPIPLADALRTCEILSMLAMQQHQCATTFATQNPSYRKVVVTTGDTTRECEKLEFKLRGSSNLVGRAAAVIGLRKKPVDPKSGDVPKEVVAQLATFLDRVVKMRTQFLFEESVDAAEDALFVRKIKSCAEILGVSVKVITAEECAASPTNSSSNNVANGPRQERRFAEEALQPNVRSAVATSAGSLLPQVPGSGRNTAASPSLRPSR
ncbi:unnamed protein product [Amoebophrya sp. A25]|nr:unnamed protein product [Amoebophrya sp. A25]|eukprot:GSA25T00013373001.1